MKKGTTAALCFTMISIGWFANEYVKPGKAQAAKPYEYKVVVCARDARSNGPDESCLNNIAKQGWRLHSLPMDQGSAIWER
jgi:hypothetical protein